MSQRARNYCLAALLMPALCLAQAVAQPNAKAAPAQHGAGQAMRATTPSAPAQAPASAPTPSPIEVDPASKDITSQSEDLARIRREAESTREKLKLLSAQAQVQEQQKKLGQITTGTSEIPELVGIEGTPGRMRAQFLTGKSIIVVYEGGMVTPDWKVLHIQTNGVEVAKRGHKTTQTILFGHEPLNAAAPSAQLQWGNQTQQVQVLPGRSPVNAGH